MPKKEKRVASRQAQLSQRSRSKQRRGPTGIPLQQPTEEQQDAEQQSTVAQVLEKAGQDAAAPETPAVAARPATPTPRPRRSSPQSAAASRQARFQIDAARYVKGEITRISVLTALIIAVLVVLTFVLR